VARLDRAIETRLQAPATTRRFVLDAAVSIDLPQSLAVLRLEYPADEIRAALDDAAALAAIELRPNERFVLIWRKGFDTAVQSVNAAAGHFLIALLAGDGARAAFGEAVAALRRTTRCVSFRQRFFSATFCTVNPEILS